MYSNLWLLLLPIAAASGWWAASSGQRSKRRKKGQKTSLPRDYLLGLNYLLNEEPDKALDVFIKMLEVDSETVETHLALGNLFRRRGEVERAIRIHQNLIARPQLDKEDRTQALVALARDYLKAGVLDRAERLFLELVELEEEVELSLRSLLDIYQQEKDWPKAMNVAKKIKDNMQAVIAHHYCELAEISIKHGELAQAARLLRRALFADKCCVRASLLLASIEQKTGRYKQAIKHLKKIKEQNADFFSEAIVPLVENFRAINKESELILYFKRILKEFPKIPIALMLSEQIRAWRGDKAAAGFVADYVRKHPSVEGLHRLVELHLNLVEERTKKDLLILLGLMQKLLDEHPLYQCENCGLAGKTLHWLCPGCRKWNTTKPTYAVG
jgi:lipopolysaccharide assembly protein B